MQINEIKEYQHKKKIIYVTNKNRYSLRNKIILKITNLNVQNDETIRFSLYENSGFIGHQQKDDDYYIRVPNNLISTDNQPTITYIYVHYFPKDLYIYEDDIQVFSEYDLSKLTTSNSDKYQLTFKEGKPYVQSLFNDGSIKDPNYKNYTQATIDNTPSDMTDVGRFPLSSHFRQSPFFSYQHPKLGDTVPKWVKSELTYPFWEAKISREELSPLISDGVENTDEDTPLNVFLNYDYLPTSTEYHQHFYGFQSQIENTTNDYNILEGENLRYINGLFGTKNNYRIIQLNNIYNDKYSIYVPKGKRYDLDLKSINSNGWSFNKCDNYYTFTGTSATIFFNAPINKNKIYSLKYLIYIPLKSQTSNNTCYISVNDNKIANIFLYQDKIMRNQWIYHEVPFYSDGGYNTIKIIGSDDNSPIYFYDIFIEEMPNYSPTIKYNARGISITEESETIMRTFAHTSETSEGLEALIYPWEEKKYTKLPKPQTDIRIIVGTEEDIYYDENTMKVIHTHIKDKSAHYEINDEHILIGNDSDNLQIQYDAEEMKLKAIYNNLLTFTKGVNNNFSIILLDEYNRPITEGIIECSIYDRRAKNKKCNEFDAPYGQCLDLDSYHTPNEKGKVLYNGINFSNLTLNQNDKPKKYYLRIIYKNKNCRDEEIITFRPCVLEKEIYNITLMSRNNILNTNNTTITNNNLPFQIQAKITNQLNNEVNYGYCELFIDNKLTQSTIVDSNGIADFYLSESNITNGQHKIYVAYYQKWNVREEVSSLYTLQCNYSTKPALPIKTQKLQLDTSTNNILEQHNIYTYSDTIYLSPGSPLFTILNFKEKENLKIEFYRKVNNGNNILVGRIKTFDNECKEENNIIFKCKDKNNISFGNVFYLYDTLNDINSGNNTEVQGIKKNQTIKYTIKILDDKKYRINSKEIYFICQ